MITESRPRIVDTSASAHAVLRSIPLEAVRWTNGFWAERLRQAHESTVRILWDLLADPDAGHVLDNFRIAAGQQQGEHAGTWWQDAWLYKWIEAAACLYGVTGDSWLDERMDEGIALIAAAQEDDGYVATQTSARDAIRYEYIRHHEVYTMGHLLTAAVTHHRMTGKESFLNVALRVADHLCLVLGSSVPPCFAHNPSAIMGMVELCRETGEARYLDCAKLIVDARGQTPAEHGRDLWHRPGGIEGTDQIQDRVPLRRSYEVVGHNVFFTYLFTGAADVYLETGDETLKQALDRLWEDLVHHKMNVNGGVSPMGHGLSLRNDIVVEAVGPAYYLPNEDSYNETCGQIGNLMWNYRMLCADPQVRYADMMEHEIYNGVLSGIDLAGKRFWYRNQLRRSADHDVHGHNDMLEREPPGHRRICCPTNVLRTVIQWQSYSYSTAGGSVWIHHYGASTARLPLSGGETLALEQVTDYPWDGAVSIRILEAPSTPLTVRLRVPGWAPGAELTVNGLPADSAVEPGAYATASRRWQRGDRIELALPMRARLVEANPKVEHCRNQVAVMRGPVLYCLESADLPEGVSVDGIYIPSDVEFVPTPVPELGDGTRALAGTVLCRSVPEWGDHLYRDMRSSGLTRIPVRLIPYYAWANRGPGAMTVWLPLVLTAYPPCAGI